MQRRMFLLVSQPQGCTRIFLRAACSCAHALMRSCGSRLGLPALAEEIRMLARGLRDGHMFYTVFGACCSLSCSLHSNMSNACVLSQLASLLDQEAGVASLSSGAPPQPPSRHTMRCATAPT